MKNKIFKSAAVALSIIMSMGAVQAAPVQAVDVTQSPVVYGTSYWTAGYKFTANADMDVTALGNFDYQRNGFLFGSNLTGRAEIGLFDVTGALLASTTITGAGGYLIGNFRYQDLLDPVRLLSGMDYVIGTWSNDPRYYFKSTWQAHMSDGGGRIKSSTDDRITLNGNLDSGRSDGLLFPTISRTEASANLGPNFLIDDVAIAPVPVPAAGLLLLSGLGAVAALRRKRRA